jgi:SAM-dependent methyltransferase
MSQSTGLRDDDPYGGRRPTSHERRAGQPWDASYRDGPPPWDIGAPQPAVVRLASAGVFSGAVLDVGCGTGDNALHIAAAGLDVLGVDVAETAVSIARESATARGIHAEFIVADALRLDRLGRVFDTVLDCALFHAFDSDERRDYVVNLASVLKPGGYLYVLCFSDTDPETAGPHPVSQHELSAPFTPRSGWSIASISSERLQATFAPEGAPAWLAKIERIQAGFEPHPTSLGT